MTIMEMKMALLLQRMKLKKNTSSEGMRKITRLTQNLLSLPRTTFMLEQEGVRLLTAIVSPKE
jgi:ABC-type phosphonate transport system ATPase subunit